MRCARADIVQVVGRARLWAIVSTLCRRVSAALLFSAPVIVAYIVLVDASVTSALLGAGAAFGVISILCTLVTLVWLPSLDSVARDIDLALGLEQRVETAVEFVDDEGPVASLLRRDAWERLRELDARGLYPLGPGVGRRTLWGLACAASLIMLYGVVRDLPGDTPVGRAIAGRPFSSPGDEAGARSQAELPLEAEREPSETGHGTHDRSEDGGALAGKRVGWSPSAGLDPAPDASSSARAAFGAYRVERENRPVIPADSQSNAIDSLRADLRGDAPVGELQRNGRAPNRESRQSSGADPAALPESATSAPTNNAPAAAGRIGDADTVASVAQAADSSQQRATAAGGRAQSISGPATGVDPRRRGRAEPVDQALAREELPPGLREYVRDYFHAIRQTEH